LRRREVSARSTSVTLCLRAPEPVDLTGTSGLRQTRESDRAAIAALARTSYRFTRFYYDENFPDERCDDLYGTWMLGCLDGLADAVFLVEREGSCSGTSPRISTAAEPPDGWD